MKTVLTAAVLILVLSFPTSPRAGDAGGLLCDGQTLYVPAYSHIYSGSREKPFLLTITLSIRNIDPAKTITVTVVDYYETQGKLLHRHAERPITLGPLESLRYVIPEQDASGGSGANFIVEWRADSEVNAPIVEAVMIGTQSQQGVSFTSRAREIVTTVDEAP